MSERFGIVGGGQLGLYLCEAAHSLGMPVSIIADTADSPALQFAERAIIGPLDSIASLRQLVADCDVITFDKEDIPDAALDYLCEAEARGQVAIHPSASSLRLLKDKALQKAWLQEHQLPTLPFQRFPCATHTLEWLVENYGNVLVQKSRCGGYDGRGVQIVDVANAAAALWDAPSIVEPYLPNCREISVLTVRGQSGEILSYPPVGMEFDQQLNSVKCVVMPADISPPLAATAVELAERVVSLLEGVGLFAIEMFISPDGELLINEISPRVHNSGHVTLDACSVSQFEQHVRAVAGLPLKPITMQTPGVMLNILYSDAIRGSCPGTPVVDRPAGSSASIYWYGKAAGTDGRKMGHINALADDIEAATAEASRAMAGLSKTNRGSEQAA